MDIILTQGQDALLRDTVIHMDVALIGVGIVLAQRQGIRTMQSFRIGWAQVIHITYLCVAEKLGE